MAFDIGRSSYIMKCCLFLILPEMFLWLSILASPMFVETARRSETLVRRDEAIEPALKVAPKINYPAVHKMFKYVKKKI